MTAVRTNFSPSKDGFKFINYFEIKLPRFKIPFAGEVDLNDVVFGLCGGMCFSALDYYYANQPVPTDTDVFKINRKLFTYLADRQLDSIPLANLVRVIDWMLREPSDLGQRMARYEIPKLRRLLDKGQPAVITLIRVKGLDDPTQNHQVLAIGYDYDQAAKRMDIDIYDPNHPRTESRLMLDLSTLGKEEPIRQSNDVPSRAFFVVDYKPRKNPPLPEQAAVFEALAAGAIAGPAIQLRWPVDSRRINQHFGENPETYKPFKLPGHEGIDLYAPEGANVYAAADGVVTQVGHPQGHPYGLQIRLRHKAGNQTFYTIYAHLSQTFVKLYQEVKAGDLIGLADNTGNSFGSHLHLTLKVDGQRTPGYPPGIVDPLPYLQESSTPPPIQPPGPGLPPPSGITAYTTAELQLRTEPNSGSTALALIPAGEPLNLLGDATTIMPKIGKENEWLLAQTASGLAGNAPAWQLSTSLQALPPSDLVVYPIELVNLRSGPGTVFPILTTLDATQPLTVLGDAENGRAKLGKMGEWLQVQTSTGLQGYAAAWLLRTTGQALPGAGVGLFPQIALPVRARPEASANVLVTAAPNERLAALGDPEQIRQLIGQVGKWLYVRTKGGFLGFIPTDQLRLEEGALPPTQPLLKELVIYPKAAINLRAQPSLGSARTGGAYPGQPLQVIETDLNAAKAKVGLNGQWLQVQAPDGAKGWAAGWFLSL